jgi:4-amino-4-deoxy-L-arabinose transferase-like glycosyltransferase
VVHREIPAAPHQGVDAAFGVGGCAGSRNADAERTGALNSVRRNPIGVAIPCAVLIAASYFARLSLLRTRTFDTDELEHLHAAWSYHQGLLPFRDFFEHHMPGIYYLLAALMRGYDIAHHVGDAIAVLFVARTVMWVIAGTAIAFTFMLGTRYGGKDVGWLSTAFLSLSVVFVGRTLEIRPDVPATAFWVVSQWALVNALTSEQDRRTSRRWWILGGLMLGGTLCFTQKALLAGPGFAVFAILYVVRREQARSAASKVIDLVVFVGTSAVPLLFIVAHFWANGAVRFLVDGVLINNLGWIQELRAGATVRWMLLRDPLFCAFATAGFLSAGIRLIQPGGQSFWRLAIFLPTASMFVGLWLIPTPFPQYLLPILPVAAVYSADFLRAAVAGPATSENPRFGHVHWAITTTAFVVAGAFGLATAQPFFRNAAVYPSLGVAAVVVAVWLARRRQADYACAVVILAVSLYSAQQLVWMADLSNAEAIAQMRLVHSATTPADQVMDGFSGVGWFRPHAFFNWMAAPGPLSRISTDDRGRMLARLRGCGDQPKIVILDAHLQLLSPEVATVVAERYSPTADSLIWLRHVAGAGCGSHPGSQ